MEMDRIVRDATERLSVNDRMQSVAIGEFLARLSTTFGPEFAESVRQNIEQELGKDSSEMAGCKKQSKMLYAVYVVDQEADTVERPDYVIASGDENARYKVLHAKGVEDPDTVDVFVQYIGTLKSKDE